jgi:hypothetical protein
MEHSLLLPVHTVATAVTAMCSQMWFEFSFLIKLVGINYNQLILIIFLRWMFSCCGTSVSQKLNTWNFRFISVSISFSYLKFMLRFLLYSYEKFFVAVESTSIIPSQCLQPSRNASISVRLPVAQQLLSALTAGNDHTLDMFVGQIDCTTWYVRRPQYASTYM